MMKNKISPEKENSREKNLIAENTDLKNQLTALQEYLNLKEEVYYRQQLLLALFRIAKALEDSLKTSDSDGNSDVMKKKKVEEEDSEDEDEDFAEDEED